MGGARWLVLAIVLFFFADSALFRFGWYTRYLEPDSSAGVLESHLSWLKNSAIPIVPEVLVIGDSRIGEGFSSRTADAATDRRLHFWNFGLAGSTPRVWYYLLRAADPTRRRFAAIAIAIDDYSDKDWIVESDEDRPADENYLVMRLGLGDCLDFGMSMHSMTNKQHAFLGCLFRGVMLRDDVQAFLAHRQARIDHAADWLKNGLSYTDGYGGRAENLSGLTIDWSTRSIHFPDGVNEAIRANVTQFDTREPVPQTGALARYRRRWLGGILEQYKDSPTRLIFLQLPRSPLVNPNANESTAGRFVDMARSTPRVDVLPANTFTDLERPEMFADGLHLNRDGRPIFSKRLAEKIETSLTTRGSR